MTLMTEAMMTAHATDQWRTTVQKMKKTPVRIAPKYELMSKRTDSEDSKHSTFRWS